MASSELAAWMTSKPALSIISAESSRSKDFLQFRRHVAQLQVAAPAQLGRDFGRHISGPAFRRVEREYSDGSFVPAVEKVGHDCFVVGRLIIGLSPDPADPAQIVDDQVDAMIIASGHDRGRPVGLTHDRELHATEPGFKPGPGDSFLRANRPALRYGISSVLPN